MTVQGELLRSARGVLSASRPGAGALEQLGWLPSLDGDAVSIHAALFEAQGATLAVTPALGALSAAAYLDDAGVGDTAVASAVVVPDERIVIVTGTACCEEAARLVVDLGADGLRLGRGGVAAATAGGLDDESAPRAMLSLDSLEAVDVDAPELARRRTRATAWARFAIAHEILGACDAVLELAVAYAKDRRQFGTEIGSFQSVQHLLAEADAVLGSLRAACDLTTRHWEVSADDLAMDALLLKGLAGRVGRTVTQASLQVLGAIGFTWEHPHHRYLRRVLTLDSLHGNLAECRRLIGAHASGRSVWRSACFVG